jgi:hypothetical protein
MLNFNDFFFGGLQFELRTSNLELCLQVLLALVILDIGSRFYPGWNQDTPDLSFLHSRIGGMSHQQPASMTVFKVHILLMLILMPFIP